MNGDSDFDKRNRASTALLANYGQTNAEIAQAVNVSKSTVLRVRNELEVAGAIPVHRQDSHGRPTQAVIITDKVAAAIDELIKDPFRSNRVIADLTGTSRDGVRVHRIALEKGGKIPAVPPNNRVNSRGEKGRGKYGGSYVSGSEDMTLMQIAAKGKEIEDRNPEMLILDVANMVGVSVMAYRKLRGVYLLSLNTDLSKEDHKTIASAIAKMEHDKQVSPHWPLVKPIADKVWGSESRGNKRRDARMEQRRKDIFDHAVGLITDTCSRGPEVEVPFMKEQEQLHALHRVNEAINCLKQLNVKIRRARG